jgi:putative ABC transport system ATP-binding protein
MNEFFRDSEKASMAIPSVSPAAATEPAIALEAVRLSLGSGATRVEVLKGITLNFARGKATAIVGPSGCGKSTLLMTLAGLERPDSGAVTVVGRRLDGMGEDQLAQFRGRAVGIVFQSFHLMPTMTAVENVAIPLELAGEPDAFARAEAELASVGLVDRADHYPSQLSGGEQQRVALARALVAQPEILLADEPTGNLDERTGSMIIDLLLGQSAKRGSTLILVTHDASLAARCDHVVRLKSGRVDATEILAGSARAS